MVAPLSHPLLPQRAAVVYLAATRLVIRSWLQCVICLLLLAAQILAQDAEAVTVVRGPYLQNATPSRITLKWRTDVATATRVEIGNSAATLLNAYVNSTPTTEHE